MPDGYIDYRVRVPTDESGSFQQLVAKLMPKAEVLGYDVVVVSSGIASMINQPKSTSKPLSGSTKTTYKTKKTRPLISKAQSRILDLLGNGAHSYAEIIEKLDYSNKPHVASRLLNLLKDDSKIIGNKVEGYCLKPRDGVND